MASARIYDIANGKIISQEWDRPGSSLKRHDRAVTDEEMRNLLRQLIEHGYWTFRGTQFIVDANEFMFRFHYRGLESIEYSCQTHEYKPSQQLSAIRSVWLSFVSGQSKDKKLPED